MVIIQKIWCEIKSWWIWLHVLSKHTFAIKEWIKVGKFISVFEV